MDKNIKQRPTKKEFEKRRNLLSKELRDGIIGGKFHSGDKLPSEVELMRRYQLSRGSIRKLLSELETAGLIERRRGMGTVVAEKYNRSPVAVEEVLVLPPPLIDTLNHRGIPEFNTVRGMVLFEAVNNRLKTHGLRCRRISCFQPPCTEVVAYLKKYKPLGVLALSKFYPDVKELTRIMAAEGIPVISLDETRVAFPNVVNLSFDNAHMGQKAAEYLVDCGHENIVAMSCENSLSWAEERSDSFVEYCNSEPGVKVNRLCIPGNVSGHVDAEKWKNMGRELMRRVIADYPDATAVFCINDLVAHGVIIEAKKNKIDVPRDISVIGCGDDSLIFGFNITTVSLEAYKIGIVAVDSLMRIMKDEHQDFASARINVNPSIINYGVTVANRFSKAF